MMTITAANGGEVKQCTIDNAKCIHPQCHTGKYEKNLMAYDLENKPEYSVQVGETVWRSMEK
jgi:hypothetical protein